MLAKAATGWQPPTVGSEVGRTRVMVTDTASLQYTHSRLTTGYTRIKLHQSPNWACVGFSKKLAWSLCFHLN